MGRLDNKVAMITGGAGGIGSGMARAMVKEGAKVVIVDLDEEEGSILEKELHEISPDSMFLKADLMNREKLHEIIDTVVSRYGGLDVLVNNAHASRQVNFEDTTQEDMDFSFGTGFYPTFYLMQSAYPHLRKTKGSVINFASAAGLEGQKTQTTYAAAKEAIRAISKVAANEWGEHGINVNIISPMAMTPGVKKWSDAYPEMYQSTLSKVPMGRWGDPETDIGPVAVFLASDDSDYMTGQTLMVDGGSTQIR